MAMNKSVKKTTLLLLRQLLWPLIMVSPLLFLSACANENLRQRPELGLQVWEDTIEGRIDEKYEIIWRTVRQVLEERGEVIFESGEVGRMVADIHGNRVIFWLKQIERKYGQLRIRAYRQENFDPNIPLANQIFEEVKLILNQ